ncbi:glycosyltransferase family 2 protein [Psychroserpens ponticola]|uniref:Glycosyltransferase family A protein n=1 Tax=Psychroserpens ponticola TaxID=2932268 RepID=A0ABY7S051_9FLAO|nr:glycosyltransferase family A protein [Psychroserpens ponticola]WCO02539.1 glycosyltransferase family A protein [Psychroserpens ponticola]
MLFSFLKYLQPTHYFLSFTKAGHSIFPKVDALPSNILSQLHQDDQYLSEEAKAYDVSWQAIQSGYIGEVATYQKFVKLPLKDNYRFIRKNFHSVWVFYVFLCRILSFHNPFKECVAWLSTRNVNQIKEVENSIVYKDWDSFQSQLIEEKPLVSVIIPTLNRYEYLKDVLKDLEAQDYSNFEVIVVDQSDDFNEKFYKNFNLNFQIVNQKEKALWLARNTAIKTSKGDWVALSEDDVRIGPDWISMHLKCLDFFNSKISAGVFYPEGQYIPKSRSFFAVASQFATGNAMLHKTVFKNVGLFDRQFEKQRMGDGEFGMRLYLEGLKSISNPFASCVDVKAGTGGLREMGSWDAFRPSNFLAPRPIPSVLYYFRRYFGNSSARLALLRTVPISIMPYQFKKNKPLLFVGLIVTILILPIVVFQVWKSWNLSSKKIKEGALIEVLT